MASLDSSPGAREREVNNYAAADAGMQLPQDPVVVVGGMRVKLWRDLADVLAPRPVLMRGLGDAIVEDISFNYTRLVGFYRPATVVLLPDDSEFHLRDNKSAPELAAAIRELVELDASYGITRRFYVFAPVKTVLRREDYPTIDEATRLLRAWADSAPHVVLLDPNPLLCDPDGNPRGLYFRSDGVNLNEHGYLRLSVLLSARLDADAAVHPVHSSVH